MGSCGAQGRLALASHCTATASTWWPTEAAELDTVGGTGGTREKDRKCTFAVQIHHLFFKHCSLLLDSLDSFL